MVAVGMGENHTLYGQVGHMLLNEIIACLRSGIGSRHVNDDPTIVRTDKSHVGNVEPSYLIKFAGYHFKQAVDAVKL